MDSLIDLIRTYDLWAVFVIMFLQSVGIPLPAYPVLLIAAALMPLTVANVILIIFTGAAGTLAGDFIFFAAGKRYGTGILGRLCKISISPDSCVRSTGKLFDRYGAYALTFVKFIPGLSTLAPVIAGAYRMALPAFGLFSTIGAFIYVGLAIVLGILFRDAIGDLVAALSRYGRLGGLIVVALLGLYLFFKWVQRYRLIKKLRMDRVTVDDLSRLMTGEPRPIILDARPTDQRLLDGFIPGSIPIDEDNLGNIINTYAQEREIVVYCSCPNEITAAKFAHKLRKAGFKRIRPLLGGLEAWIQSGHKSDFTQTD